MTTRRSYKAYGVETRRLTLALHTDEWTMIEAAAKRLRVSVPYAVEALIRDAADAERQMRDDVPHATATT